MSEYSAQLIRINDIDWGIQNGKHKNIRKIDKCILTDFMIKLNYETWVSIFYNNDVNIMFNPFLSVYLRAFYSSFPLKNWISKLKVMFELHGLYKPLAYLKEISVYSVGIVMIPN